MPVPVFESPSFKRFWEAKEKQRIGEGKREVERSREKNRFEGERVGEQKMKRGHRKTVRERERRGEKRRGRRGRRRR